MARLDSLLRALGERGANELLLRDGTPPTFRFDREERPVSNQVLRRAQILHLVSEIAGDRAEQVSAGRPARFSYAPAGAPPFACELSGTNGDFAVRITPSPPEAPPAAASSSSASPDPAVSAAEPAATHGSVDALLRTLVERGGSDLHLCAGEVPMIRVDGEIVRVDGHPACTAQDTSRMLCEMMPERNRREYDSTGDTDFAHEIEGLARFRVNVFTDRHGPGGVFRVIPSRILTAEDLGLPKAVLDLCHLSKGLVLVTGPTGSGKSTTLAAMIDHVNDRRADHIITIEDPIEFVHPNKRCLVNQREVVTHTQSFKKALRAALREDPDIVLVGELRDLETIEIAIETAETGHLVFGTLHTTTACSTVDRIIDQFPTDRQSQIRTMLSESLKGVVAQTLLRKIGGGRVAALEILIGVPAIANLIREGKTFQIPSIMQTGKKHGMILLNEALMDLVRRKVVAPEDAWAKAVDRNGLAGMFRGAGIQVPTDSEH